MSTETATVIETLAPKTKAKSAAKTAKAKAKTNGKKGSTVRERVFSLLAKTPLTGAAIVTKLSLSGIPSLLKDEAICNKPRIRRKMQEGVRGVVYELTALGKKHLEEDLVDSNAAPSSAGQDWPNGR